MYMYVYLYIPGVVNDEYVIGITYAFLLILYI